MSLDAIGIVCKNLQDSLKFYSLLGLDFQDTGSGEHFEATTPSGLRIMLDTEALIKKINPAWQRQVGNALSLGFVQKSPAEVDERVHSLVEQGASVVKAPWDAFWGQRYATVQDPDGHPIDIFAQLP